MSTTTIARRRPSPLTQNSSGCCRCDSDVKHKRLGPQERARVLDQYGVGVRDVTDALVATGVHPERAAKNLSKGYLECVIAAIPRIEKTSELSELGGLFAGDPTGFTAVARLFGYDM